jgi:hypothetical protein
VADYEIFAPDSTTMQAAFTALGISQSDGRRGAVRYVRHYYGTKYDAKGVALPGVYAIVRWVPPSLVGNPFPPAGLTLPAGLTIGPLPADSPQKFFG